MRGDLARTRRLGAGGSRPQCDARSPGGAGQSRVCGSCAPCSPPSTTPPVSLAHRAGAFERIGWLIEDWDTAVAKLDVVEARMVATLDELAADRPGLLDRRPVRGRCGSDPRRDRRPDPVRQRPRRGQARRPRPTRTDVGHLHRQRTPRRCRPTRTTGRGMARGVGCAAQQPRLRRAVPTPHHPRGQPAQAHPGPDRHRRRDPAAAPRRRRSPAPPGTPTSPATDYAASSTGSLTTAA